MLLGLTVILYQFAVSTIWVALGSITFVFFVWLAARFSREYHHITLSDVLLHKLKGGGRNAIVYLSTGIMVAYQPYDLSFN